MMFWRRIVARSGRYRVYKSCGERETMSNDFGRGGSANVVRAVVVVVVLASPDLDAG